jgi:predicted dinucleotide-binding enzyme
MKARGVGWLMGLPGNLGRRDVLKAAGAVLAFGPMLRAQGAAGDKAKIGVIGSGNVGSNLGRVLANAGHQVMFSSRNLEHDKQLAAGVGANARAGTPAQAAAFGDVLIFAVPYGSLPDLGKSLDGALKGKVVLDACNPFPNRDGEIANRAREQGAGRVSAELLPGARIVRAFNAIGAAQLPQLAHRQGEPVGVPIAGDDKDALAIAERLIKEIGFEPVVVGGLAMGKYLNVGTPLAGVHTPDEIRKIAATLK